MTKNIKKAIILFGAVICILGIKGNVYAQDIKLVAPIITSSQMENENFVIRWRTSEELKGQEYKIYCATSKDGTYEYVQRHLIIVTLNIILIKEWHIIIK